jgi:hypothetical protein
MNRAVSTACLLVLVAIASSGASVAAGDGPPPQQRADSPSIVVFGPDGADQLTTFTKAKCGKEHDGAFRARAISTDKAWRMLVGVPNFKGYDEVYDIPFGTYTGEDAAVLIRPAKADTPSYASWHHPSYPVPGYGEVRFDNHGKLMGVGFGPAMYDENGQTAITFGGGVTCKGKKKHH